MWTNEAEFDRDLGIETDFLDKNWGKRRVSPCQPTPLVALEAVVERLAAGTQIVDFGCGTGRAVFFLAACGMNVTGVELDPRWMEAALENLRRCRGKRPEVAARVELVGCAAQEFVVPAEVEAAYCFNPFPASVLRGVLKRVVTSLEERPRRFRFFCYYPDDEWVDLLEEAGWRRTECVDLRGVMGKDARERLDVFER